MRLFPPIVLIMLATCPCPLTAQPSKTAADELDAAAHQFIDQLVAGEYKKATERFDAAMTQAMPTAQLQKTWRGLTQAFGQLERRAPAYRESIAKYTVIYIPCQFQRKTLEAKIVFDNNKKIAGLFFVPQKSQREYKTPAYVDAKSFNESETTVGAAPWKLPATLATPTGSGPFPAVVFVHGSGPNDRDETIGPNKPFKDLGQALASRGIITLRYDKRTKVHSAKMSQSSTPLTVKIETIDDVIMATQSLKANPAVDPARIFVVGHSMGAYLVPRIATADDQQHIAGFILLAGSTRPIETHMLEQFNYIFMLDGALSDAEQTQLNQLKGQINLIQSPDLANQPPQIPILGATPSYWLDLRGYDPTTQAQDVKQPMLILQGERDYQVTMIDFQNWKKTLTSRDNVQFKSFPDLNHLFITGSGKSTPNEYSQPGNVSQKVVDEITRWINRH